MAMETTKTTETKETKEAEKTLHQTDHATEAQFKVAHPDAKAIKVPNPLINRIPDGSMDMNDVLPGYGPLEGSPKENDPTQLANPGNPLSPVTKPFNPSNPANMPAMQSDKPASEQRIYQAQLDKANPKKQTPEQEKAKADKEKTIKELHEKIGKILASFDNRESNIPASNEYWSLIGQLRAAVAS